MSGLRRFIVLVPVSLAMLGADARGAVATAWDCGAPPPVASQTLRGVISGSAKLLTGRVGGANLKVEFERTLNEIYSRYPNADRVVSAQYYAYEICQLVNHDNTLTTDKKIQVITDAYRVIQEIGRAKRRPNLAVKRAIEPTLPTITKSYRISLPAGNLVQKSQTIEVDGSGNQKFLYAIITPDGTSDIYIWALSKYGDGIWRGTVQFGDTTTPNGYGFTLDIVGSDIPLNAGDHVLPASAERLSANRRVLLENINE